MSPQSQQPTSIQAFRFIHLTLNVVCVGLASYDWDWFSPIKDRIPATLPGHSFSLEQTSVRIPFLVVTVIIMAASFALLVLYWVKSNNTDSIVIKPFHEVVYYGISSASLCIVSLALTGKLAYLGNFFVFADYLRAAVSFGFINSAFYLASAIQFWKYSKTN